MVCEEMEGNESQGKEMNCNGRKRKVRGGKGDEANLKERNETKRGRKKGKKREGKERKRNEMRGTERHGK